MTFRKKPIAQGLATAFGGLAVAGIVALPAQAQQAQQSQQLERVEVTGSNIRRVEAETIQPVQILTREEIERSGKSTVQELLISLPVISGGTFSEGVLAGNSFAPGTAGASLRGLGVNSTLVLINGRRAAAYPFAQNIDEAFLDLNSIPISAIERIEVLKAGASAIYGSDAIAGVINVILRKDYRGLEASARAGTTVDGGGTTYSANVFGGFGNLATDRYNVTLGVDYFSREKIGAADREFSKNANQEPRGFDWRSPTGNPGSWIRGTGAAQTVEPFANCPPNRVAIDPGGLNGTACTYDFASDNWLSPKTERIGAYLRGQFDFSQNLSAFGEYRYSSNTNNGSAAPTPGSGPVPAANPSNPFGELVTARYRFTEVGPRLNETESDTTGLVLGLKGTAVGIDWEAAYFASKSESVNTGTNYIDQRLVNQAFAGTVPGFAGQYWNLTGPNNPALVNALRVTPVRTGEYENKGFDIKGAMESFALPGGNSGFAFGLESREESLSDVPDPLSALGVIVGSGGTSSNGSRDAFAAYIEGSFPLFKNFESQIAVRYDDYSDFGDATTGKVALSYRPTAGLLFRGGWANGFRAPSLVQAYLGQSISFPSVRDTPRCNAYTAAFGAADPRTVGVCGAPQVRSASGGNPNLEPEKSDQYNLGFVFEPMKDFTISVDYYSITQNNIIDQPTANFLLNNANLYPPGAVNRNAPNANDLLAGAPGQLQGIGADPGIGIARLYYNANFQKTWGYDIELSYATTVGGIGRFQFTNFLNYIGSLERTFNPGTQAVQLVDAYGEDGGTPRYRNLFRTNWSRGAWDSTVTWNYIPSYDQSFGVTEQRVQDWSTIDLQVVYRGVKNLELSVGGNNIFNQDPPWGDGDYYGYDSAGFANPLGAFWYAQARYRFF